MTGSSIVVLVVLVAGGVLITNSVTKDMEDAKINKEIDDQRKADIQFAREELKKVLKYPLDAEFPGNEIVSDDPKELWLSLNEPQKAVVGFVKSKNAYGAVLTSEYEVVFTMDKEKNKPFIVFIVFNKEIFKNGSVTMHFVGSYTYNDWKSDDKSRDQKLMACILAAYDGEITAEFRKTLPALRNKMETFLKKKQPPLDTPLLQTVKIIVKSIEWKYEDH